MCAELFCCFFGKTKKHKEIQPLTEAEIILKNFTPSEQVIGYCIDDRGNSSYRPNYKRRVAE
jgi:hypothetical protein